MKKSAKKSREDKEMQGLQAIGLIILLLFMWIYLPLWSALALSFAFVIIALLKLQYHRK